MKNRADHCFLLKANYNKTRFVENRTFDNQIKKSSLKLATSYILFICGQFFMFKVRGQSTIYIGFLLFCNQQHQEQPLFLSCWIVHSKINHQEKQQWHHACGKRHWHQMQLCMQKKKVASWDIRFVGKHNSCRCSNTHDNLALEMWQLRQQHLPCESQRHCLLVLQQCSISTCCKCSSWEQCSTSEWVDCCQ